MSETSSQELSPAVRDRLQRLFENGNKQMNAGGHDYATEMFIECVKGDPSNILYLQSFVQNLRQKFGDKKKKSMFAVFSSGGIKAAEVKKNWKKVLESGLEMLRSNPWNSGAYASMGKACLEMDLQDAGLAYLKLSIDSNPNDVEVNRLAAQILRDMKKFDDAIACWARVKKLKPDDQEADRALGDIMVEKTIHRGGYDTATSTRDVQMSGIATVAMNRSEIPDDEDVMGRQLSFEEQIQKRLKKDPNDATAYIDLAEYHFQADRFAEAEQAYNNALKMSPDNTDLTIQILETQKRRIYAELLRLKAEYGKTKSQDIREKFDKKKVEYDQKVLQTAQERVKIAPANAGNHFELGAIFYQRGLYKEAIAEYQFAKTDATRKGESLLALAQCFQQIKQYKLASTHYKEAIENIPDQGDSKKKALYLATKLAIGLKEYGKADQYANDLAAIDFSYKDIGDLLDKIQKAGDNA